MTSEIEVDVEQEVRIMKSEPRTENLQDDKPKTHREEVKALTHRDENTQPNTEEVKQHWHMNRASDVHEYWLKQLSLLPSETSESPPDERSFSDCEVTSVEGEEIDSDPSPS